MNVIQVKNVVIVIKIWSITKIKKEKNTKNIIKNTKRILNAVKEIGLCEVTRVK